MVLYLKKFESGLRKEKGAGDYTTHLIWGDAVDVKEEEGEFVWCRARTREGWIRKEELGEEALLEIYIIDVGQGDSVLLKTPDARWHIVDGGNAIENQMVRKGAVNFLRWKFQDELRIEPVPLENVVLTHPDLDHYGGLMDILTGDLHDGRRFSLSVKNFFHSGIGRFGDNPAIGKKIPGRVAPFPLGNHGVEETGEFIVELLDERDSFAYPARKFDSVPAAGKRRSVLRTSLQLSHLFRRMSGVYRTGTGTCRVPAGRE